MKHTTPEEILRLSRQVQSAPRRTYYLKRSTRLARFVCLLRHFPLINVGHDFEHLWSRKGERLETIGERAFLCRICWRVESRGPHVGFLPEISYGPSPCYGRRMPCRRIADMDTELGRLSITERRMTT